jgi:hypothetical protein
MDWHGCGAEHHGDVDGNLVECGHFFSLLRRRATMSRYKVTMVWRFSCISASMPVHRNVENT